MIKLCGIAAYVGSGDVSDIVLELLVELQHRGQESAGIALVSYQGHMSVIRGRGLVFDVLTPDTLEKLKSKNNVFAGIGHVRYSTSGGFLDSVPQPFIVGDGFKIAIAFNGTIANYIQLAKSLGLKRALNDTHVLAETIYRLTKEYHGDVIEALRDLPNYVIGSYSIAILTTEPRLVIARDPRGFRPLAYMFKDSLYVASETAALSIVTGGMWREVAPGEIISFDGFSLERSKVRISVTPTPCIFEYVYFARPDTVFNGVSVYEARIRMGIELAKTSPVDADAVMPVPESGRYAAMGYSRASGIPLEEGLFVNRYLGRGFIMPPTIRRRVSELKYGIVRRVVKGKRVVLVDDSIVRGTTMKSLILKLRNSGANEVHVRIASPPFKYPCFMGIDIASRRELLINRSRSINEMAKYMGADSLGYNTLRGLIRAVGLVSVCHACFSGLYPFPGLNAEKLEKIFQGDSHGGSLSSIRV